jgi:subtilisin family serine protease
VLAKLARPLAALVAAALCAVAAPSVSAESVRLIIKLAPERAKSALARPEQFERLGREAAVPLRHVRPMAIDADVVAVDVVSEADAARVVERLRARPGVEFVDVDRRRHASQSLPINDETAAAQHYLSNDAAAISAYAAWDVTHGSSALVVAVLDTGYRPHAGMAGRILPGYDMIADPDTANDGNGRDADAQDPGDWVSGGEATSDCAATNSSWHGTSVAGIVGANTDDGRWTAGIDWAAKILPVRVLGKCGGYDSDIVDAIAWAAGVPVPGAPVNPTPAQVINLSLGGKGDCPSAYPRVVGAAFAHGITKAIVAAAGNEADDVANHSPANCPGIIAVASTTFTGQLARYSNFGTGVTLSAPGGTVLARQSFEGIVTLSNTGTTTPGSDTFANRGGTSFSAPMVSGVVSLMLSVAPGLSPDQVASILIGTAKPFPAGSDCTTDRCGAGIVDAGAAVRAAASAAGPPLNYEGLWWRSPANSESGWGINLAHQDEVMFATWFTYDTTGKAWWLSMTAERKASNVYSGPLYETHGPPFSTIPFDPDAVARAAVGSGTLTFTDANNGVFQYTVNGVSQTKPITRQVFGPLPVCTFGGSGDPARASNYQDLWWAAPADSESGWGINFTQQGDAIFATWFTYDGNGDPMWLSAQADKRAAGVYAGPLLRTSGPAFSAEPFDPTLVMRTPVGTATLTFANGNTGTFAYTVDNVSQSKAITRQILRAPGTICQ